ncbi:MAG: hypothetical protein AAFV97_03775, partial [Bacteroidota bacterium]
MNTTLGNASQLIHRKGAKRRADVPAEVLDRLNRGELATKTLAESLVIDFRILLTHAVPHHTFPDVATDLSFATGFMQRNRTAAAYLVVALGRHVVKELGNHVSDVVRGWVALAIGFFPNLTLKSCLRQIRRFANDPHFAVREYAWMAARPHLAKNLESSFRLLLPWAQHQEANIRRFAIEVLRPRGVWCMHIDVLRPLHNLAFTTPAADFGRLYPTNR